MKKFFTQLVAIVATLGLQKKFETKTLSAEEMNQLTDAYNKAHGEGAFAKDFAEFQSEQDAAQKNQVYAESLNAIAEELGLGSEGEKTDSTAIVAAIKELKNSFEKMASKAEEDKPTDHASQKINITGVHTKDFAFGVQNPMFSASKRWNKLAIDGAVPTDAPTPEQSAELRADFNKFAASLAARYAALNKSGQINRIAKDGVDFSAVAGVDMSDRFFQVRQDMLISRIIALASSRPCQTYRLARYSPICSLRAYLRHTRQVACSKETSNSSLRPQSWTRPCLRSSSTICLSSSSLI